MARYRVLGALATLFGLPVLIPVPNLGGHTAIATEVQRLRDLAARGLRVPTVLAAQEDGFIMRHLGRLAEQTPSLGNEIEAAVPAGPEAVLRLWLQGLRAIELVHNQGTCLSQALPATWCAAPTGWWATSTLKTTPRRCCPCRCAMAAMHCATPIPLPSTCASAARWKMPARCGRSGYRPVARRCKEVMEQTMHACVLRHLPQSRKLGRDVQQVRAAYDLLRPDMRPRAARPGVPAIVEETSGGKKAKGKGQTRYARRSELPSRLWLTDAGWAHPYGSASCFAPLFFHRYARHHPATALTDTAAAPVAAPQPTPKPVADARPRSPGLPGSSS